MVCCFCKNLERTWNKFYSDMDGLNKVRAQKVHWKKKFHIYFAVAYSYIYETGKKQE